MSYANQSAISLLRGPLLHTPQGWAVLATVAVYVFIAAILALGFSTPPLGKDLASILVVCAIWPFITFLIFVKHNLPDFRSSWGNAVFVSICAIAPIAYVGIYG